MRKSTIEYDRRQILLAGIAGLGALGSAPATSVVPARSSTKNQTPGAAKLHVEGSAPLLPNLAKVMPAAPGLMDALSTEFAPSAAQLATQKSYWLAINAWITDRLSGPIMDGQVGVESLGEQAWAVYASACWGGIELRQNWGMPPVIQKLGIKIAAPYTEVQQRVVDSLTQRLTALAGGGDHCLELLPTLMHEDSTSGAIQPIAYNAGVQVVMTEDPPIGQRRPNRKPRPSAVRINGRDFMRVDYDLPTPQYLKVWRAAFERAVTANPVAYEKAIAGGPGQKDLRDIWKRAVNYGNTTWGGDANDKWTDAYFDDSLHWSSLLTFGLEAVGLAAFVAVINQDPEAAKRAVMGNALYTGATSGWLIGLLDVDGKLPAVVAS
jgi:hypothetical protein